MNRSTALQRSLDAAGPVLTRDWRKAAACASVDPELFFPEPGHNDQADAARRICRGCPVRAECLEYALENGEQWGIFGGLTEHGRRKLKRATRKELAA